VGGIVGVHNGQLRNDDALFKALGCERLAEVDSEAAFALLRESRGQSPTEVLGQLEGSAALAWMQVDDEGRNGNRVLHLARLSYSPLWLGQTRKGSTLLGTLRAIRLGAEAMGTELTFQHEVKEGTYLRVRLGVVGEWVAVPGIGGT
jgi:hypothetical protein